MTITRLHPGDRSILIVSWFNEEGKMEHARLHVSTLEQIAVNESDLAYETPESQVETKPNV